MQELIAAIKKNQQILHPVVPFNTDKEVLVSFDFTDANASLTPDIIANTEKLGRVINDNLEKQHARYGIGGYGELRVLYSRSRLFDATNGAEEPRRFHLGVDIWGAAGTPVFAPLGGMVHSVGFNNSSGDYGATLILLHQLEGIPFYTLYGHIRLADINSLMEGQYVSRGQQISAFGEVHENGNWPPHLHFQIIIDIELKKGDYPGVCRFSEREKYLANCPDPDLILQLKKYITSA